MCHSQTTQSPQPTRFFDEINTLGDDEGFAENLMPLTVKAGHDIEWEA